MVAPPRTVIRPKVTQSIMSTLRRISTRMPICTSVATMTTMVASSTGASSTPTTPPDTAKPKCSVAKRAAASALHVGELEDAEEQDERAGSRGTASSRGARVDASRAATVGAWRRGRVRSRIGSPYCQSASDCRHSGGFRGSPCNPRAATSVNFRTDQFGPGEPNEHPLQPDRARALLAACDRRRPRCVGRVRFGAGQGGAKPLDGQVVKMAWIDPLSGLMAPVGNNQLKSWQFFDREVQREQSGRREVRGRSASTTS